MVGENSQYWPEVLRAKELINEGFFLNLVIEKDKGPPFFEYRNVAVAFV